MGHSALVVLIAGVFSLVSSALARPCVKGEFKGRIAWSAYGNHNDPDDWIASPLALAKAPVAKREPR